MTNLIVAAFTLCYFAVTLFLCRGMRLSARDICLAGLMSAATLVLRCFLITLPNGSHISLGAMLPILLLSLLVNARVAFCAGWVTGLLAMLLLPDRYTGLSLLWNSLSASPLWAMPASLEPTGAGRSSWAPHWRLPSA